MTPVAAPEGLKFGTSGLRGLVVELVGQPAYGYALAFATDLVNRGLARRGDAVLIGRDLRASSLEMSRNCAAAIAAAGLASVDCGELPTPALALAALERGSPAIMVTGSHIPEDRNGLKFYRADGEIGKKDEAGILAAFAALQMDGPLEAEAGSRDQAALERYKQRYADFFAADPLAGMTIGVYQHSSVGRDILAEMLQAAGAATVKLGRADHFVPVDTEALRPEDVALAKGWATEHKFDAIVSMDGDADRPLIADESGAFVRGDLVGLLTANYLGADAIVTPVTSNSAAERAGSWTVRRTKVGSPYVIAGMEEQIAVGSTCVVGFEANGGVLLGSPVELLGRRLAALPTRDAMLPILSVLAAARQAHLSVSALVGTLNASASAGHRLKQVPSAISQRFVERLGSDAEFAGTYFSEMDTVASVSLIDGTRVTLANGAIVHYRASGNAPELRCYAEAADQTDADALLAWGLASATKALASH